MPDAPAKKKPTLGVVWREARDLIWARRARLGVGMALMAVSRLAGLVLPATSKVLIDDVIGKSRGDLLWPLALAAGAATLVQAVTGFALSQVLGVAAQTRDHRDAARRCRQHVTRLPVRYFDSTQTGVLISRIMNDAEGIRNLVGTGLVQLVGSLVTAVDRAGRAVLAQLAADDGHARGAGGVRRRHGAGVHAPAADSSASAARSTPRSPAGSPSRWAASASSRPTRPSSARRWSSRAACTACSATSPAR